MIGTSLVVQWLRHHVPNAWGRGSSFHQETSSHMLQPRVCMPQLKILCAATKTVQPNEYINNLKHSLFKNTDMVNCMICKCTTG